MALLDELLPGSFNTGGANTPLMRSLMESQQPPQATYQPTRGEKVRAALTDFTGNLMFTLGEALKASASAPGRRGTQAGLGAALQAPTMLRAMEQEQALKQQEQERKAQMDQSQIQKTDAETELTQLRALIESQKPIDKPNIDPLSPEGINATVQREEALQGVRPPVVPDMTPEEKFIDLKLREMKATNGGAITTAQEIAARKNAKQEWSEAGKDPFMEDMNLRLRELQVAQAEQRLQSAQNSGLTPAQQTQILRMGSQFDSHAITKKYNVVAEAAEFVKSVPEENDNPGYDQALIYAFAKAMDPESVVREGEYATVQKYAQSWVDSFKFNAQRVLANTEFLTPAARRQMKTVIDQRSMPVRTQYENLRRETIRKMNAATGRSDGENYLIDYGAAFAPPASTEVIDTPDGKKWRQEGGRMVEVN